MCNGPFVFHSSSFKNNLSKDQVLFNFDRCAEERLAGKRKLKFTIYCPKVLGLKNWLFAVQSTLKSRVFNTLSTTLFLNKLDNSSIVLVLHFSKNTKKILAFCGLKKMLKKMRLHKKYSKKFASAQRLK